MPAAPLRTIVLIVVCLCDGALAVVSAQPRHAPGAATVRSTDTRASRLKHNAARMPVAARDGYIDPAAPYKANRLSSPRVSEPILNIPGQTTVLTREVLDDMNATSVRGALGSVAGVTIGR
ncbi:Plug domain-containing protein [Bradyrhizobium sp. CB3481]|uniref:Plug domain-containing protein n=1 Tax=Bradyrhizobium sp. CB3481 TaxID=3039158 RepID=UPI0024B1D980|nr:Plug domain-containing protein [Bradyrhizobium sp. CB3481]WFU13763.1 Plug domain-containing protein [Bradyrhizobium sp. CB3481]